MISIIMPLYNNEKYITEAIQSVIEQSYTDWELIIINNASTDNSQQIAENISKTDTRISLINLKENKGVSYARNLGIKKSKGTYITFLDSDDLWHKDFLKLTYNAIETNSDFVYARFAYLYKNNFIEDSTAPFCNGYLEQFIHFRKNRDELLLPFHIGSILIKKKLLFQYNIFFNEKQAFFEDLLFLTKILCISNAFAIKKTLMYYRQHSESTMHKIFNPKSYLQELSFWDQLYDFAKIYNPNTLNKLNSVIVYRTYRIIWILVKNKYIKEGLFCIDKYYFRLKYFYKNSTFKINDRLKCRLFTYKNKFLLQLIQYF